MSLMDIADVACHGVPLEESVAHSKQKLKLQKLNKGEGKDLNLARSQSM